MRKKSTLLALSVSALLVLTGCQPSHTSSSESTPADTPIQTTPISDTGSDTDTTPTVTVTITSTETEVLTEGTLTLTAEVAGVEDGKLTWAIESKNPETMDASIAADTGVLQAGTVAGTLVVTATCEGVTAKVTITVKEAPVVTTVTILGGPTEAVYTGREVKLDAYVTNGPSGYTVDWTCTSDPADMGATVDANGKVTTGSKPGKITVTATVGDAKDSVTITVVEAPVVDITTTVTEVTMGSTLQLAATITNGEGGAKPTWAITSKNPSTMDATIDAATGLVTAGKIPGKLTVTASYEGSTDTITLTVPAPVVDITTKTTEVQVKKTLQLEASITKGEPGAKPTWAITSKNPSTMDATIDAETGLLTAGKVPGQLVVTASYAGSSDTIEITIPTPVVSVDITSTETEVALGGTLQLNASITNGEDGAKPTWAITSKAPETMDSTIDSATGLLTAGKVPGKLTITASYKDVIDTFEITIPAPAFATDVFPVSYKMTIGDSYFELVQGEGLIASSTYGTSGHILIDDVLYFADYDEKQGYVYHLNKPLDPDDMTIEGAFATYDLNGDATKYVYDSTDPTTGNHTYVINLADTKVRQVAARIGIDPETAKAVVDPNGDLVSFAFVDEGKDIAATITAVDDLSEEYKAYVGIDITNAPANLPTNSEYKLGLTLTGVSEEDIQWSVKTEDGMNATIDQDGTLHTGSVAGKVTVTASDGTHSTSVDIMVQLITVTIGNVPTEGVYTGEDIALIANVVNSEETPVWSIEMTEGMNATIDEDGRLHTGTVGGTITVTVRLPESDYSDTVEIVVKEYLPDGGETDEGIGEEW